MDEGGKGLSLVILGIVAVIAVIGLVLLFSKTGVTGNYAMGSELVQFNPYELCQERIGCPLSRVEGGIYYSSKGPLVAICDCPSGPVTAPLVRPFNWREEFYPQG